MGDPVADIDSIMVEYSHLRQKGVNAKDALRQMRNLIESLPRNAREELAEKIREFESGGGVSDDSRLTATVTQPVPSVQPLSVSRPSRPTSLHLSGKTVSSPPDRVYCWNCGKPNRPGEVVCVHCGSVLGNTATESPASTRQLENGDSTGADVFKPSSTLIFRARHSGAIFRLRPQDLDHELVVGRMDSKGIVSPDLDLTHHGAAELGVSRMHMSIRYEAENNQLKIADIGSSNGLFINGQRLVTKEVRVLRNGDQIRLGQFVLDVAYRHEV